MATLVLGAAGAAFGAGFGGAVLGLSGAVLGRAAGATLGQMIDQTLLGGGSAAVEVGRLDRRRLTGATEGRAIARVVGPMRMFGPGMRGHILLFQTRYRCGATAKIMPGATG